MILKTTKKIRIDFFTCQFHLLIVFFILFLNSVNAFAIENQKITINKIKIIIDEQIYNWQEVNNIPEKEAINFTSPKTVISFLSIKPNETIYIKILEQKLFDAEKRLMESGYFFSAKTYWVSSSNDQNLVNVIIEVKEGFLFRFGGGAIFGVAGKDNLFGLRKSIYLFFGYNLNGVDFKDELFFGSDFIFRLRLLYQNSYGFSEITFNKIDLTNTFGYRFSPQTSLILFSYIRYQDSVISEDYSTLFFYNGKFFTFNERLVFNYNFYKGNPDFYLRGLIEFSPGFYYYLPVFGTWSNSYNNFILNLKAKTIIVLETSFLTFGISSVLFYSGGVLDYIDSYNLSYSDEGFVRTSIANYQKFPDATFITNIELRSKYFVLPLSGIFNFSFSFFIFDDIAFNKIIYKQITDLPVNLITDEVNIQNGFYILNSFGFGIRFGFDIPINVFFTLTIGWNLNGNYSIILFFGKGF
ncbi:MAG: hypothetical protein GYA61_03650 [Spirochaetales bacterium]|nr:hypothetical protein [Spirochaetales bacterium]